MMVEILRTPGLDLARELNLAGAAEGRHLDVDAGVAAALVARGLARQVEGPSEAAGPAEVEAGPPALAEVSKGRKHKK